MLLAGFASAAVEMSGATDGKISFEVSYGSLDEDDDNTETINYTKTLTFQNTGTENETVTLSKTNLAGYTVALDVSSFELNASASQAVVLTVTIPVDDDSGEHTIGTLTFDGTAYSIVSDVESMLEINEIVVYADGEKENTLSKDGDETNDLRPGTEVELRFEIKNHFDKNYDEGDIDINKLEVKFKDSDDEDDFGDEIDEEPQDSFDKLDADETVEGEDVVVVIDIPNDAQEGNYELEIYLEGEDGNNAEHTVTWLITLVVDREKDDVQFEKAELEDNSLKCGESTYLNIELVNYGSNSHDDAAVSIYNVALGVNENFVDIELDKDPDDKDNSFEKRIPITVDDSIKAGDYHIEVRSYLNNDESLEFRDIKLTVEACSSVVVEEEEEVVVETDEEDLDTTSGSGNNSEVESESGSNPITSGTVMQTVEDPYITEDFFIATIIIAFVLILAMIIIFVVILQAGS
ncbi:MAG: hypothetical protein KKH52_01500 [Nanoarchaeota archaeon]|nr:hypothetical protein [Nanoarchaeota archaeon]MBU1622747.1 hypothetical protein [Nanoarchaeota archaeon]MBU1974050.1 hypothetical protein [Nanoarchaeota archaeon]